MKTSIKSFLILLLGCIATVSANPGEYTWEEFQSIYDREHNLRITVQRADTRGLWVEHQEMQLLIPADELIRNIDQSQGEANILRQLNRYVEYDLIVRIIEMEAQTKTITLSQRAAYIDQLTANTSNTSSSQTIQKGTSQNFEVTHVDSYGIFVRGKGQNTYSEKYISYSNLDIGKINPRNIFSSGQSIAIGNTGGSKFSVGNAPSAPGGGGGGGSSPSGGTGPSGGKENPSGGDSESASPDKDASSPESEGDNPEGNSGSPSNPPSDEKPNSSSPSPGGGSPSSPEGGQPPGGGDSPSGGDNGGGDQPAGENNNNGGNDDSGGSDEGDQEEDEQEEEEEEPPPPPSGEDTSETREITFQNRHKIIYECKFELPKKEDCTEDTYRSYLSKAYAKEYEDYRNLLEDLYYDNNCTYADIITLLFSEKDPKKEGKQELECEQRTHEDLKEVGLEQEKPARINRFLTCAKMVEETPDKMCAPLKIGDTTPRRILRLRELAKNSSDKTIELTMELTKVAFEERLKRREILAMHEEVLHRNDQLWQRLNHTTFNYFKEMQEFSFQFQPFIKCIERVQVAWDWVKEKSIIF